MATVALTGCASPHRVVPPPRVAAARVTPVHVPRVTAAAIRPITPRPISHPAAACRPADEAVLTEARKEALFRSFAAEQGNAPAATPSPVATAPGVCLPPRG